MVEVVTEEHWRSITLKAVDQAQKGNYQARRWLTDYIIGPATQSIQLRADLEGPDLLAILRQKAPEEERAALTGEVIDAEVLEEGGDEGG
jgi:hypothetical protein